MYTLFFNLTVLLVFTIKMFSTESNIGLWANWVIYVNWFGFDLHGCFLIYFRILSFAWPFACHLGAELDYPLNYSCPLFRVS